MGERVLRRTQAALEVTRGLDLAATRRVYGKGMMTEKINVITPADEQRGTLVKTYRSQPGLIDASFPFSGVVTYEDLAWWLQCALKGGVTGVLRNTAAYDYTFTPTQTLDDLKTMTVEWGDDTQAWEAHFGVVDTFEISAALNEQLKFSAGVILDDWTTTTFTGALADRVTEDALAHLSKFAIGNAGAQPGGYIAGRFIGWKLKINNHAKAKFFMDGATAKYTGMGRDLREYSLELAFEGNAATVTERANYDTTLPRVARVTVTGSNIAGAAPATAKQIDITLPGIWTAYDAADRDTNTIFNGVLEAQYDAALGYDLNVLVTNGLVTLP